MNRVRTTTAESAQSAVTIRERGRKSIRPSFAPAQGIEALGTSAICVAVGVVLSFIVHPLGISPRAILPMHFPIFFAGILLSPLHAAMVGIITPALSMGLMGMPTSSQVMRMMPELAVYGAVTSLVLHFVPIWRLFSGKAGRIAASVFAMLVAMIAGRLTYIFVSMMMTGFQDFRYYATILVAPAIPGIIAQIVLIPLLAYKIQTIIHKP